MNLLLYYKPQSSSRPSRVLLPDRSFRLNTTTAMCSLCILYSYTHASNVNHEASYRSPCNFDHIFNANEWHKQAIHTVFVQFSFGTKHYLTRIFLQNFQWNSYIYIRVYMYRPLLWSSDQSSWLEIQRSGFDSCPYKIFWEVVGPERGPFSLVSTIEELLGRKSSGSCLETGDYCRREPSCWPRDIPLSTKVGTNLADK
jgi:hypothetical protein